MWIAPDVQFEHGANTAHSVRTGLEEIKEESTQVCFSHFSSFIKLYKEQRVKRVYVHAWRPVMVWKRTLKL